MNDRKIKKNRTIVIVTAILLIVSVVFVNDYFYPLSNLWSVTPEETPESIIESTGTTDVIYFSHEPRGSGKSVYLGDTPIIGVGLYWYPPQAADCDAEYHIVLTAQGYNIVKDEYIWTPGMDEPVSDKYNKWNWAKFHHYKENALFPAGDYNRVYIAMRGLNIWHGHKALADMFFAVFKAAMTVDEEWRIIEIDLVYLGTPKLGVGVSMDGKATPIQELVYFPERLSSTLMIFRSRKEEVFVEGRLVETKRTLDDIVEEGELTWEEVEAMFDHGQLQILPAQSFFGAREYRRGHNCEWAGREIKIIQDELANQ